MTYLEINDLTKRSIKLLQQIISIPSFSGEEQEVANLLENYMRDSGENPQRKFNNVWCSKLKNNNLPTLLLNSHIDTVKPNVSYSRNPFEASIEGDRLYGLGSNDAGGSLVTLLHTFLALKDVELPFNLIFAATAQEENSGEGGISSIIDDLGSIDLGIIGEPTSMDMAVAEKGLMVLDCCCKGVAAHAGWQNGDNAIYKALLNVEWMKNFKFPKISDFLGATQINVTKIQAGSQHNIIPDICTFVADVRINELYNNEEVFEIINSNLNCEITARSFRLRSSYISTTHPAIVFGKSMGLHAFGSPTLSDQALLSFDTFKMGPGESKRSHIADEFICLSEIEKALRIYPQLLKGIIL